MQYLHLDSASSTFCNHNKVAPSTWSNLMLSLSVACKMLPALAHIYNIQITSTSWLGLIRWQTVINQKKSSGWLWMYIIYTKLQTLVLSCYILNWIFAIQSHFSLNIKSFCCYPVIITRIFLNLCRQFMWMNDQKTHMKKSTNAYYIWRKYTCISKLI